MITMMPRSTNMPWIVWGVCMFTVLGLALMVALYAAPAGAQAEQHIDITIKDFSYGVEQVPMKLGVPTVIRIRNEDAVRHDFHSAAFHGMLVEMEHEGVVVYGRDVNGVFLDPARGAAIRFTPETPGRFEFQCSIHKHMKGELLLLNIGEV